MMKKISTAAIVLCMLMLPACGGDGDDDFGDGDTPFVSGVWRGAATLTENQCNLAVPATVINFVHTVNQNENAVVLDNEQALHFVGNVVGDNGFSVDALGAQDQATGGVTCDFVEQIEYDGIDDDDDDLSDDGDDDENADTAEVAVRIDRTCSDNSTCRLTFAGNAVRDGGTGGAPTPTATPTPAAARDCLQTMERSYTGDGACGIGAINTDVTGSSIVLEPLGINSATTFNPVAGNAGAATSVRTDLTILGQAGYTCTLECNAPITFDMTCVREGAPSCTERF